VFPPQFLGVLILFCTTDQSGNDFFNSLGGFCYTLLVPKTTELVEKVVGGPIGGPKQDQNKSETYTKRDSRPLKQGSQKGAKEFFNRLDRL
jgi:hypothetical protein